MTEPTNATMLELAYEVEALEMESSEQALFEYTKRALAKWGTPAPVGVEPVCQRCRGSGEDPEGYYDQSRGPDGATHDGPCRICAGSGGAPEVLAMGRVPLHPVEAMRLVLEVDQQNNFLRGTTNWAVAVARAIERHHGIKGGQHGADT